MSVVTKDDKIVNEKIVENATCTFCGCCCDDITLTVDMDKKVITKAKDACVLGKSWFLNHVIEDKPIARIAGKEVPLDDAIDEAANILMEAKFPILYGMSDTICEAQRHCAPIMDDCGGTIDTTTSVCHGPSGMAFQGVGEPTMTLGEVKNRADFVMYWGGNPAEAHPRHFARYAVTPEGMYTPNGKDDRTVVIVDIRHTKTAGVADIFLQLTPGKDFELLWMLRAACKGFEIPEDCKEICGLEKEVVEDLFQRMKNCTYGVIFFGMGLTMSRGRHFNSGALMALATDLNEFTHFVAKPARGHGNVTGADNVVSWQTGYPFGVNFSRGHPRFNPGEFTTVDTLSRKEADAALIIASDPVANFPKPAIDHITSDKCKLISIDTKNTPTSEAAHVSIQTSTYGINTGGTVYRMDDVPISLRPAFDSPFPSDLEVLTKLRKKVNELSKKANRPYSTKKYM